MGFNDMLLCHTYSMPNLLISYRCCVNSNILYPKKGEKMKRMCVLTMVELNNNRVDWFVLSQLPELFPVFFVYILCIQLEHEIMEGQRIER